MAHSWPKRRLNDSLNHAKWSFDARSPCKRDRSETFVARRHCVCLGLSRRRSRVRVPSLPSFHHPFLRPAFREHFGGLQVAEERLLQLDRERSCRRLARRDRRVSQPHWRSGVGQPQMPARVVGGYCIAELTSARDSTARHPSPIASKRSAAWLTSKVSPRENPSARSANGVV